VSLAVNRSNFDDGFVLERNARQIALQNACSKETEGALSVQDVVVGSGERVEWAFRSDH
jgi:hypothetical protein